MPVRNRIKKYISGGVYHIYNRALEGREVFKEEEDLVYFKEILKRYLDVYKEATDSRYKADRPYIRKHKQEMNLEGQIDLLAYCVMPDHFHFLVRQYNQEAITRLMRRLITNYVMYFNRRYKRRGVLFENVYRAVLITDETVIVDLSRYIHLNPVSMAVKRYGLVETVTSSLPEYYMYSSYQNYLGSKQEGWLKPEFILEIFKRMPAGKTQSYQQYVEAGRRQDNKQLKEWVLE
jgi:putative transposase